MRKMKIKIYNIPKNNFENIDENRHEEVTIYGKRIMKNIQDNEKENWFFYDIENVTYMFKFNNKRWYEKVYRLTQDCDWPKLIKISYFKLFLLLWYHKRCWVQKSQFWINFLTILTAIVMCILTLALLYKE